MKLSMPSVNQAYYYTRVGYFWTDDTSSSSYSKHAHYIKSDDVTSVLTFQYLYNQKEGYFERLFFQPGVLNLGQVPLLPYKQCLVGSNASGKQLDINIGAHLSLDTTTNTLNVPADTEAKQDSNNLITSGGVAKIVPIFLDLLSEDENTSTSIFAGVFANDTYKNSFFTAIQNAQSSHRPLIVLDNNGYNMLMGSKSTASQCSFICASHNMPKLGIAYYNLTDKAQIRNELITSEK